MKPFRTDNTDGYTQSEMDELNDEWQARAEEMGLEEGTYAFDEEAQRFADEVARR